MDVAVKTLFLGLIPNVAVGYFNNLPFFSLPFSNLRFNYKFFPLAVKLELFVEYSLQNGYQ